MTISYLVEVLTEMNLTLMLTLYVAAVSGSKLNN